MVDEEALLAQFTAQFDQQTDDSDTTQTDSNDSDNIPAFDADRFLQGLDAIFARHAAASEAAPYLEQAMSDAENAEDDAGLLTVLNETMGFYRSQGWHDKNQWIVQRTIELALRMGLEGSETWATTLINCATAMRAAKQYDQAEDLYTQALHCAENVYPPKDRRIAALHNNLSMLYQETGKGEASEHELREAMRILREASDNPSTDIDLASSCTNLALTLLDEGKTDDAHAYADEALAIHATARAQGVDSAHYAAALAGAAQVRFAQQKYGEAAAYYREALNLIEDRYGRDTDYWRITEENLSKALDAAKAAGQSIDEPAHGVAAEPMPSGMELARRFWEQAGKPMLQSRYPDYAERIAVGLVGYGSECFGFDDALSRDHDFAPRFCLWLTDEDYAAIGTALQEDYERIAHAWRSEHSSADLPDSPTTPRAQGTMRRDGVFRIGDFFETLTGYREAPPQDAPHEWLALDESTLATATNGRIFADALGIFSKTRQGFTFMPEDVRLSLISRRLGMLSQAGQYNLPRMLQRGDGAAAMTSIHEFAQAAISLVFLVNNPVSVGYAPYYKWRFAALRRLSRRMATRLPGVCAQLEEILHLASAACFGVPGTTAEHKASTTATPPADRINAIIERICADIVGELQREGLTRSQETFLEWQRPYVEEHIVSDAPCLHSL
ncbi:DUF4037 domain-containing protein [Bifidobacterium angulatum]|uniref:DUF4037 domain-containing protein n=1 Tax=Bifidobacterium angulatum TaxID=1683 RepID=UPI00406C12FC